MKLVQNWREILKKAWSVKFNVIASVLAGLEVVVAIWQPAGVPSGVFAGFAGLVSIGSNVARIFAQKEIQNGNDK